MTYRSWKKLLVLLSILVVAGSLPRVYAQETQFNFAQTLAIRDLDSAEDGDVVSITEESETLELTKRAYDERMHGVIVEKPVAVYRTMDSLPVARTGIAMVNVTSVAGLIRVGDYVTSSDIPGKGQKGSETTGFMLGVALNGLGEGDGREIDYQGRKLRAGKIKVAIGIGPASPVVIKAAGGVFGTLQRFVTAIIYNISTSRQLERIIRMILAALVALLAILISYQTFGRNVTKGMEAIGRNPLARVSIQSMIVVNVIMIILVSIGGIILSLVIVSL